MINHRRLGIALLLLAGACVTLAMTAVCAMPTTCARALSWSLLGVVGAVLAVAAGSACGARCAWLAASTRRMVRRFEVDPIPPARLVSACAALGIRHLRYLEHDEPLAFTAGTLRPYVAVSSGLMESIATAPLRGVLAHEAHHARRRDPARRTLRRAVADVVVVAPALRWWARYRAEHDELAADRAALRVVSPSTLAEALLVTSGPGLSTAIAAFDGAAEARVAQLAGEPVAPQRCPRGLLLASAAGTTALGAAAVCAAEILAGVW